jgi:hypothetical protein
LRISGAAEPRPLDALSRARSGWNGREAEHASETGRRLDISTPQGVPDIIKLVRIIEREIW